jgi:hypothetical protein
VTYRRLHDALPDGQRGYYPAARLDIPRSLSSSAYHAERKARRIVLVTIVVLAVAGAAFAF